MKCNNRFIALDTETGGLPGKGKLPTIDVALTEIAVVVIENETLEIVDKQSWLISSYDENLIYSAGAEKASGISKDLTIKEGVGLDIVYESFKKVLIKNKIGKLKPILIIQNKKFDIPFIENMFSIFNDKLETYIGGVEDTLDWARYCFVEKPNFKLASIAEYCGLTLVQAHRALPDTIITAKVWIYFMKNLRGESVSSNPEITTVTYREEFKF